MRNAELCRRIAGGDFVHDRGGIERSPLAIPLPLPVARALATGGERLASQRAIARGGGDEIERQQQMPAVFCERRFPGGQPPQQAQAAAAARNQTGREALFQLAFLSALLLGIGRRLRASSVVLQGGTSRHAGFLPCRAIVHHHFGDRFRMLIAGQECRACCRDTCRARSARPVASGHMQLDRLRALRADRLDDVAHRRRLGVVICFSGD